MSRPPNVLTTNTLIARRVMQTGTGEASRLVDAQTLQASQEWTVVQAPALTNWGTRAAGSPYAFTVKQTMVDPHNITSAVALYRRNNDFRLQISASLVDSDIPVAEGDSGLALSIQYQVPPGSRPINNTYKVASAIVNATLGAVQVEVDTIGYVRLYTTMNRDALAGTETAVSLALPVTLEWSISDRPLIVIL